MKFKQDHLVGGILIALGVAAIVMSLQIPVKGNSTDPGSRLFPMMASILLTVCGVGVFISAVKSKSQTFLLPAGWKKLLLAFGTMILYVVALKYAGFVLSTPVFLFVITTMLADGQKVAIWKKLIYSLAVTALSWYLFQQVLSMSLPSGILL